MKKNGTIENLEKGAITMRMSFRWFLLAGIVLLFLITPVYGGWKEVVTKNQIKATEYISQLKSGADPDSLTRPKLKRGNKAKSKKSHREILKAMDEAETLARSGKHDLIEKPEFFYKGVSEKKAKTLQTN